MEKSHFLTVLLLFSLALAMVSAGTKCEDGWTFFQRPSRGVCLKFIQPQGNVREFTYDFVQKRCQQIGASLAGVQNLAESEWFDKQTISLIWIAAKRVPNSDEFVTTDPYIDGKGWYNIPMYRGKQERDRSCECLYHNDGLTRVHGCEAWLPYYACVKLAT